MIATEYIVVSQLCKHYQVPQSFFITMHENAWIELILLEEVSCVHQDELPKIEKILRLHQSLDIHLDSMDIVLQLLEKVEDLQSEIISLKKTLKRYE